MNGSLEPSRHCNHVGLRRVAGYVRATSLSLAWMISASSCAVSRAPTTAQNTDTLRTFDVLERKICLTIGARTYSPADTCESRVDRPTYVQPLFDVYRAAPPILKAYLCSLDRIYVDDQLIWNADFRITTDPRNTARVPRDTEPSASGEGCSRGRWATSIGPVAGHNIGGPAHPSTDRADDPNAASGRIRSLRGRATCCFISWRTKSHMSWLTTTAP